MSKESPETIFAVIHDGELCSALDAYVDALTLAVNGSYVEEYCLARSRDDEARALRFEIEQLNRIIKELDGDIINLREEIEHLIEKENDYLHAQRD